MYEHEFCRGIIRPEISYAQRIRALQGLPINAKHIITQYAQRKNYITNAEIAREMRLPLGINVTRFF